MTARRSPENGRRRSGNNPLRDHTIERSWTALCVVGTERAGGGGRIPDPSATP